MPENQPIDKRIYDGADVNYPALGGAAVPAVPAPDPVAVPIGTVVHGSPLIQQGDAARRAAQRTPASFFEAAGAAMSQWTVGAAADYYNMPKFEADEGDNFSAAEALKHVPFQMDLETEKFLLKSGNRRSEFEYKMEHLEERNMAQQAMGDNMAGGMLGMFTDPGYIGVSILSGGVGGVARLAGVAAGGQRLAAGAAAVASTYGLGKVEQQVAPITETQIVANALLFGAAESMLYRGGKLVRVDPEAPNVRLQQIADEVAHPPREVGPDGIPILRDELAPADGIPVLRDEVPGQPAIPVLRDKVPGQPEIPVLGDVLAPADGIPVLRDRIAGPDGIPTLTDAISQGAGVKRVAELRKQAGINSDRITYVNKAEDVRATNVDADAKAVYVPEDNRVYLVADNIKPGDDIRGLLLHEVGVHMNAEHVLGAETLGKMMTTLEDMAASGNSRAKAAFDNVPAGTPAGLVREEALGYYVEANHKVLRDSIVSRFVSGMRDKLRGMGLGLKLSENDIMQLVRKAARATPSATPRVSTDGALRYSKGLAAAKTAEKLSVSLHKTLSKYGAVGKKIADLLVDDPLHMTGNSVANQQRAIRADMSHLQFKFEDAILDHMRDIGWGTRKQITNTKAAIAAQRALEKEVFMEVERRGQLVAAGQKIDTTGIAPHIDKAANLWNDTMKAALAERKRSGELGAAAVADAEWYVPRKWDNVRIEDIADKLVASGMTADAARASIVDSLAIGMQRSTGIDAQLAKDVATATLDRARRKGYFEDTARRGHMGEDTVAEVRDILEQSGIPAARREKVLEIMTGKADEAGKAPSMKHRMGVALDEPIGTTGMTLADMLDTSMVNMGERYLDGASASAAFARKGLVKPSDIAAMRKELLESIPEQTKRGEAAKMFDNTVAALRGDPVGEEMHRVMRQMKGLTQMVGLRNSGLFQMTEYATMMADHGTLSVVREMFSELPFVRGMLSDPKEAGHLRNVLARNSSEDIRIRPFLSKMEDNFEIPMSSTAELAIMQAKQLTPYLNGLKFIQGHQARVAANLMVNTFERAAKGEIKALAALEHYGLESHIMSQIRGDIAAHGMDTAKWLPETWDAVRAPMTKMMDEAVLRSRTGEIPAFAQFSTTGKFIFTFRSFVLGAHNKVLAGTLNRKGFSGLSLILLHQLPLTYMIAQASNTMAGKPPLTGKQAIGQALGQAGAMGLLSEAIGIAFGEKQQFGEPGMIAVDRLYKIGSAVAKGDAAAAGAAAFNSIPLLSIIPPLKMIPEVINPTHAHKQ